MQLRTVKPERTSSHSAPIASLKVDVMALQETTLVAHYIENMRAALRREGYAFHPGHVVTPHRAGGCGDSFGVGFLATPGVEV